MAKPEKRLRAIEMRENGDSLRTIAKNLKVSKSSVSRWTKHIELSSAQQEKLKDNQRKLALSKGTISNASKHRKLRIKFQNTGRTYAKRKRSLHMMGCMLYWAEGSKDRNRLEFVNSDIHMMQMFIQFLRIELGVSDNEISVRVTTHETASVQIQKIEKFWLDTLNLTPSNLRKTQIKKGSDSRKNRLPNGICSIRVDKTEYVQHIYGAIQEYGKFSNDSWLL